MDFNKQHAIYERQFFNKLIKEFRSIGKKIPFNILTEGNAENILSVVIKENDIKKVLIDMQFSIGVNYSQKIDRAISKAFNDKKRIRLPLFNEAFMRYLLSYYSDFGGENIKLLTETYIAEVVKEIRKSALLNERVEVMRDRIFKLVNSPNFYKWQALRIARTETTFAMNSAKNLTTEFSEIAVEKVWSARIDGRERDSHREANGEKVGQKDFFIVGGEKLLFPGDKMNGASAGNLVNCRCSFGYRGKRDSDGKLIYLFI